ncbi:MAG: phage holin family protein [Candidatus Hydrogenedentales bacterium]|jgi:hypothetical protein
MSNDPKTPPESSVMELIGGIITDVHLLIRQQLALSRHEIKSELGHAQSAGYLMAIGLTIVAMGSVLLCGMLVHLLALMAPQLPLWGCYGIVGAPIAVLGAILCMVGIQRFGNFNTATVGLTHDLKEKLDG